MSEWDGSVEAQAKWFAENGLTEEELRELHSLLSIQNTRPATPEKDVTDWRELENHFGQTPGEAGREAAALVRALALTVISDIVLQLGGGKAAEFVAFLGKAGWKIAKGVIMKDGKQLVGKRLELELRRACSDFLTCFTSDTPVLVGVSEDDADEATSRTTKSESVVDQISWQTILAIAIGGWAGLEFWRSRRRHATRAKADEETENDPGPTGNYRN